MTDHPQPPACEMPAKVRTTLLNGLAELEYEWGKSVDVDAAKAWVRQHGGEGVIAQPAQGERE